MDDGVTTSGDHNIRYAAATTLNLGSISTSADVSLIASNISDSGTADTNIAADELRIITTGSKNGYGAGTSTNHLKISVEKLAANINGTGTGGLFITESNDIEINQLSEIVVHRVASDATTGAENTTDTGLSDIQSDGHVVLISAGGDIGVSKGNINDTGIIANDNILIQAANDSNMTLTADIISTNGNISLNAGQNITQHGDISTAGGTIDLESHHASIVMRDGNTTISNHANIRYKAFENISVAFLNAGTSSISLIAGNHILDAGDNDIDIRTANLRIDAGIGIGESDHSLEISVDHLSAVSGSGGMFITEADGIAITQVDPISIHRVGSNASISNITDAALSDLTTSANGAIVLNTTYGDITVTDGQDSDSKAIESAGNGNILLNSENGSIFIDSSIDGGSGNISLIANTDMTQTNAGDIFTTETGTIDIEAGNTIAMLDGAVTTTENANIRYKATSGDINLSALSAGSASISLIAGTSILDAGDTDTDISASNFRIESGMGAGESNNHLDISVDHLTANATDGGIFLTEISGLSIDSVGPLTVNRVAFDATISNLTDTAQADLTTTSNGAIALDVVSGDLIITDGDTDSTGILSAGTGNIYLNTADGTIIFQSAIDGGSGNISAIASQDIIQHADIRTDGLSKTIDLIAGNTITMAEETAIKTTDSNIHMQAGSNIILEKIDAGTGNISILALSGDIIDLDTTADSEIDIFASGLILQAGSGIGAAANHIETAISTLTTSASENGIFITESDGVTLDSLTVDINRVDSMALKSLTNHAEHQGMTTGNAGHMILVSNSGNIILNDDMTASGGGNILLKAVAGSITQHNAIDAGSGNLSIIANTNFDQKNLITTTSFGTIDIETITGAISMDNGVTTLSENNIRYAAATALNLGIIDTRADVSLIASSISDAGTTDINIAAEELRIITTGSGNGVGTSTNHLEIRVEKLAAHINGTSGLFITESNDIEIDQLSEMAVHRVATDATTGTENTTDAALSDIQSDAHVILVSKDGDMTVGEGNINHTGIIANENILLQAAHEMTLTADISSRTGNISINAGQTITQQADISTSDGSIDLESHNAAIKMRDGNTTISDHANIRYKAFESISVGSLNAKTSNISLIAGTHVLDAGDNDIDIQTANLRINAGIGIGETDNSLELSVSTVSAHAASGGINLLEHDDIIVNTVGVTVQRVDDSGITFDMTDDNQSDLITTSNGSILLTTNDGGIIIEDGENNDNIGIKAEGNGTVILQTQLPGKTIRSKNFSDANIVLNAGIVSDSSQIVILSAENIFQNKNADILTSGDTIDIEASYGSIVMDEMARTSIGLSQGTIQYSAKNDVIISGIQANDGNVVVMSTDGHIADSGDHYTDIEAKTLILSAASGIGTDNLPLETSVDVISGSADEGGINILEEDDIIIDHIDVTIQQIDATDLSTIDTHKTQSGLNTSNGGSIELRTINGSITINQGDGNSGVSISDKGNLVLESQENVILNSDIMMDAGEIEITATKNITQNASINLADGNIKVRSLSGSISMNNNSQTNVSGSGTISYTGDKDVALSVLSAEEEVLVTSESGSISDNSSEETSNIISNQTFLKAFAGIGQTDDIETSVLKLDAQNLGETGHISINDIGEEGTIDIENLSQNNTRSRGDIILKTSHKTLNVPSTGKGVSNLGSGNIFLQTDNDQDIIIYAPVKAVNGNIDIYAANELDVDRQIVDTLGDITMRSKGRNYDPFGYIYKNEIEPLTMLVSDAPENQQWLSEYNLFGKDYPLYLDQTKDFSESDYYLDYSQIMQLFEYQFIENHDRSFETSIFYAESYSHSTNENFLKYATDSISEPMAFIAQEPSTIQEFDLFEEEPIEHIQKKVAINSRNKQVDSDARLTMNRDTYYVVDPILSGQTVETWYAPDNQSIFVMDADGIVYGPYAQIHAETVHVEKKSVSIDPKEPVIADQTSIQDKTFAIPVDGKIVSMATLLFDQDQFQISPKAQDYLKEIANNYLTHKTNYMLYIEAHTSPQSSNEHTNYKNGLKLGKKLRQYMVDHFNVDPIHVRVFSFGSERISSEASKDQMDRVDISTIEFEKEFHVCIE